MFCQWIQCQFYLYFAHLSIFQNIPSHSETHCLFKWCVFFPWTKPGPTIHLASTIPSTSASQWKMSKTAAKLWLKCLDSFVSNYFFFLFCLLLTYIHIGKWHSTWRLLFLQIVVTFPLCMYIQAPYNGTISAVMMKPRLKICSYQRQACKETFPSLNFCQWYAVKLQSYTLLCMSRGVDRVQAECAGKWLFSGAVLQRRNDSSYKTSPEWEKSQHNIN